MSALRQAPGGSVAALFLGSAPRPALLALAAVVGAGVTAAWAWSLPELPVWRAALAASLFFDLAAGVVVNLTRSTNDFYQARPALRWVFLAVHWHLVPLAWLLKLPVTSGLAACSVALAVGGLVNMRGGNRVIAGAALVVGFAVLAHLSLGPHLLQAAQLFLLKVGFAFAVDHSQPEDG